MNPHPLKTFAASIPNTARIIHCTCCGSIAVNVHMTRLFIVGQPQRVCKIAGCILVGIFHFKHIVTVFSIVPLNRDASTQRTNHQPHFSGIWKGVLLKQWGTPLCFFNEIIPIYRRMRAFLRLHFIVRCWT